MPPGFPRGQPPWDCRAQTHRLPRGLVLFCGCGPPACTWSPGLCTPCWRSRGLAGGILPPTACPPLCPCQALPCTRLLCLCFLPWHKHSWPVFRAIPSSTGQRAHLTQVLSSVLTRWDLESLPLLECACPGAWRSPVKFPFTLTPALLLGPSLSTLFPGTGRVLAHLHRARQTQQSSLGLLCNLSAPSFLPGRLPLAFVSKAHLSSFGCV